MTPLLREIASDEAGLSVWVYSADRFTGSRMCTQYCVGRAYSTGWQTLRQAGRHRASSCGYTMCCSGTGLAFLNPVSNLSSLSVPNVLA